MNGQTGGGEKSSEKRKGFPPRISPPGIDHQSGERKARPGESQTKWLREQASSIHPLPWPSLVPVWSRLLSLSSRASYLSLVLWFTTLHPQKYSYKTAVRNAPAPTPATHASLAAAVRMITTQRRGKKNYNHLSSLVGSVSSSSVFLRSRRE